MWQWLKSLFGFAPAPDPRPDPEDADAYDWVADLEEVFAEEARHFQMLRGGGQPSDEVKKIPVTTLERAPRSMKAWWVDVYDGPLGKGYQVCFEVLRGSDTYRKVVNIGPETWREQDWTKVVEVPLVPR